MNTPFALGSSLLDKAPKFSHHIMQILVSFQNGDTCIHQSFKNYVSCFMVTFTDMLSDSRMQIIGVAPTTQYTHVRNKKYHSREITKCCKSDLPYLKELLLKERIGSLWKQILSFKRSSHFEKGHNCRESFLDTVVFFDVRNFFSVLATPLQMEFTYYL